MSISPCGRDVVLASKEGLHVIDLDSPYSPPRYLPHHTPWEVADVQWSPFAARDQWVVSTSNQKALVWNLAMKTWQNSIEIVLHAHSRAITDINFSAFHPDVLATVPWTALCTAGIYVHRPGRLSHSQIGLLVRPRSNGTDKILTSSRVLTTDFFGFGMTVWAHTQSGLLKRTTPRSMALTGIVSDAVHWSLAP